MAYIIAEPCIGTKDTACVDVCPVDCIHPAKNRDYHGGPESQGTKNFDEVLQLYIHPQECSIVGPLFWQIFENENSCHRADWNASATVNYRAAALRRSFLFLGSLARRDTRDF